MSPDTLLKPNRIWTNPNSEKDEPSLVCLKADVLCLAVVSADDLEKIAAVLADGGEVVAENIPLETIAQLQGEDGDSDLSITYQQGEGQTASVTITLADWAQREELLEALRERLGPTWTSERRPASRRSAPWWLLGVTACLALVTWFMYTEAQAIAAGRQLKPIRGDVKTKLTREVMREVEEWTGATGVLILGGGLASLCMLRLAYAVARPPAQVIVRPEKG
jgi:hypothetical protein